MAIKYIEVKEGQSIWNVAVQEYGSRDGVLQLMIDNPGVLNFENTPLVGLNVKIDTDKVINKDVVAFFVASGEKPATAVDVEDDEAIDNSMLLETGDSLLLEDGNYLLIE